jgi:hypothetical protein
LSKNKITPIVLPTKQIEEYLEVKLKNSSNKNQLASSDPTLSTVRALVSSKAGNGKSTHARNFFDFVSTMNKRVHYEILRIKQLTLNVDEELNKLFDVRKNLKETNNKDPMLYHIDIANETFNNVDLFLFNLAILGYFITIIEKIMGFLS